MFVKPGSASGGGEGTAKNAKTPRGLSADYADNADSAASEYSAGEVRNQIPECRGAGADDRLLETGNWALVFGL